MTRINTNVSSLIAQNILGRNNEGLQTALNRLSTGLRINSGKDDPSGLIASELLRSDIAGVSEAISNSERANQVIATTDSALSEVTTLLNDIRGLVTEAANSGALSEEQIEANQLQIDSSLEALNRIAQTTSFQGKRLLDGSLDFITVGGDGFGTIADLSIEQANLGTTGQLDVDIDIDSAATQATLNNASAQATNANATANLVFAAQGRLTGFNSDATAEIDINAPGAQDGTTVQFTTLAALDSGAPTAEYDAAADTLTITVDDTVATDLDAIANAINTAIDTEGNATDFVATVSAGDGSDAFDFVNDGGLTEELESDSIAITFEPAGPDFNDVDIEVATLNGLGAANATANYDVATKTLLITIDDTASTTTAVLATAIGNVDEVLTAVATDSATGIAAFDGDVSGALTNDTNSTANTLKTGGGVLSDSLVFRLAGSRGSEVFQFADQSEIEDVANAINLVSDATGVTANNNNGSLELTSIDYGSSEYIDIEIIDEGGVGIFGDALTSTRNEGTDIVASINGAQAVADGNEFSINTATLDIKLSVDAGSSEDVNFSITGGGSLFQLGPDVVTNQQARLGVGSVDVGSLGGVNGRLYQLQSGGTASIENNANLASRIVDDAIRSVTGLRGRLGAFQKTTVDTNVNTLQETLVNLTESESLIRDADFAAETAALTRSQILVQSGTTVLSIANQNPQNALALLR